MTYLPEYADTAIKLPPLKDAVWTFTACYLRTALVRNNGHMQKAARELGIHRNTMMRLARECGVKKGFGKPPKKRKPNPKLAAARRLIGLLPLSPKRVRHVEHVTLRVRESARVEHMLDLMRKPVRSDALLLGTSEKFAHREGERA